jgi:hypothetical protein
MGAGEPFLSAGKAGTDISMFVSRELSPGVRFGAVTCH